MQHGFKKGMRANRRGMRFGRLTIVSMVRKRGKFRQALVKAVCTCGSLRGYMLHNLTSGGTLSCGCLQREVASEIASRGLALRHGHAGTRKTRLYTSWASMMNRVKHPIGNNRGYAGVKICDEWQTFEGFLKSFPKGRPAGTTLGRIADVPLYSPETVRWMTAAEQGAERRKKNAAALEER